jgi:glycerol uptake facilitator-like aquaporin
LKALSWSVWPLAVYILAPVVGGIAGFFLNDFVKGRASR